ncbi:hypothetical protein BD626DRAFT_576925 [Schizophyllum amplum]|uniref:Uncharacterized protein n=1 Tax=Schizophyllum amplum TaxID=97359 RepID=A0A550BSW4_9AGAR|nr:hypothetical protein BD626DRAFT_576925 [Auriculariopsis ampla]
MPALHQLQKDQKSDRDRQQHLEDLVQQILDNFQTSLDDIKKHLTRMDAAIANQGTNLDSKLEKMFLSFVQDVSEATETRTQQLLSNSSRDVIGELRTSRGDHQEAHANLERSVIGVQTTIMKRLNPLAEYVVWSSDARARAATMHEEANSALADISARLGALERLVSESSNTAGSAPTPAPSPLGQQMRPSPSLLDEIPSLASARQYELPFDPCTAPSLDVAPSEFAESVAGVAQDVQPNDTSSAPDAWYGAYLLFDQISNHNIHIDYYNLIAVAKWSAYRVATSHFGQGNSPKSSAFSAS